MRRQLSAVLCSAVLGFMASSSLAIAQQKTAKAPATPATLGAGFGKTTRDRQVYSSIKDLMESIIDPSADILWGAVGTVVDQEGVHESIPKSPEEWLDLRRAAV